MQFTGDMLHPDFFIHDRVQNKIVSENKNYPGAANYDKPEVQLRYCELFFAEKYGTNTVNIAF